MASNAYGIAMSTPGVHIREGNKGGVLYDPLFPLPPTLICTPSVVDISLAFRVHCVTKRIFIQHNRVTDMLNEYPLGNSIL